VCALGVVLVDLPSDQLPGVTEVAEQRLVSYAPRNLLL